MFSTLPLITALAAEVDETDELLMADPDDLMNVEPDLLPRRMLHDFAFYNAEVRKGLGACLHTGPLLRHMLCATLVFVREVRKRVGYVLACRPVVTAHA
eukprot:1134186-Pelagomonas_calceolata.AAC.3